MRFIFADAQDFIDPGFDFSTEEYSGNRQVQRDDTYAHEYFDSPPYDGLLVSRAILGDERRRGKYSTVQMMRFLREGASAFLRYDAAKHDGMLIGDSGAFSYVKSHVPPYSVEEMVDYYACCGFTHGVSVDHVILGYNERIDGPTLYADAVPEDWRFRHGLTLKLAQNFLRRCESVHAPFQPIGVAQGWSPRSYREAVLRLIEMGYEYVALGGLVPLKVAQIHRVLQEVRDAAPSVRLHLFGFTKADNITEFVGYQIESFDSTSPMLRAFKDEKQNYLAAERWYTAIRVPHADENRRFKEQILAGAKDQRQLRVQEQRSLQALRSYAGHRCSIEEALEPVLAYGREFSSDSRSSAYRETLIARPWEMCPCRACREAGIEVVIFRGSNRNRRRGFHNLWEFNRQLQAVRELQKVS